MLPSVSTSQDTSSNIPYTSSNIPWVHVSWADKPVRHEEHTPSRR